jgi:hypothetical protein
MPKYIASEPGDPKYIAEFLSRELRRIENGIPDGRFSFRSYTAASLPAGLRGDMVFCSNGSAGNPCIAVHDGTNWRVVALGAVI